MKLLSGYRMQGLEAMKAADLLYCRLLSANYLLVSRSFITEKLPEFGFVQECVFQPMESAVYPVPDR